MDADFFGTKYFFVPAVIAILLLAGGAWSYSFAGSDVSGANAAACDPIRLPGDALASGPPASDATTNGGNDRTVAWTLPPQNFTGGDLRACTAVGDVAIAPSSDAAVHVEFHIHGATPAAVAATRVDASFASIGGKLGVAAWESQAGRTGGFNERTASADLTIRVPAAMGAAELDARTDVGSIGVQDVLVGNATLRTDVGDITARGIDMQGNLTATTDVGKADVSLASVEPSTLRLTTDVDDVTLHLPQRADVGYDVTAASNVGEVKVTIGPTDSYTEKQSGPGGNVHARTKEYDSKPTKVIVAATSDVGDVTVVSG